MSIEESIVISEYFREGQTAQVKRIINGDYYIDYRDSMFRLSKRVMHAGMSVGQVENIAEDWALQAGSPQLLNE
jgi:hypothetical protein|tara:strand:+ start:3165 stop:3386 length:222 start_codon:yes stop_codon:yes gene_type:complete